MAGLLRDRGDLVHTPRLELRPAPVTCPPPMSMPMPHPMPVPPMPQAHVMAEVMAEEQQSATSRWARWTAERSLQAELDDLRPELDISKAGDLNPRATLPSPHPTPTTPPSSHPRLLRTP